MVKLNLGPSGAWHQDGWQNLDLVNGYDVRKRNLDEYADTSVDVIYTSHCIEHLEFEEVAQFVEAAYRVLRPGGILRVVVPDVDILADILATKDIGYLADHCSYYRGSTASFAQHVESLVGWDRFRRPADPDVMHRSFYTWSILSTLFRFVGFQKVERRVHCDSAVPELREEATLDAAGWTVGGFDNPLAAYMSLYVEATK